MKTLLIILWLLWLVPEGLFAQQQGVTYELEEIVVIGERIFDPPYSFSEQRASEIEAGGIITVAKALEIIPGVDVRTGKKEANIILRGFGQRGVIVLVDGRPIYEPYFGSFDLSQLLVDNVAKIKVIKGPALSLYGANALGGVVNIITKRAAPTPITQLSMSLGDNGFQRILFNHGRELGRLNYWITLSRNKSLGYPVPSSFVPTPNEDGGRRDNSDYANINITGKIGWKFNEGTEVALSLGNLQSEKELPPSTISRKPRYWRFTNWRRRYVDATARIELSPKIYIKAKAFHDLFYNVLVSYKDDSYTDKKWKSTYDNSVSGAMVLVDFNLWGSDKTTAGCHLKRDLVNIQKDTGAPWRHYKTITLSLPLQSKISFMPRVFLIIGSSYDVLLGTKASKLASFNPQMGLLYRVRGNASLYCLLGKKTRFPTLKEWYGSIAGNIHLRPERAITYDLGIRWRFGKSLLSKLSLFKSDVKDLIGRRSREEPWENIDSARMEGMEIEFSLKSQRWPTIKLNYAYLHAINTKTQRVLNHRPKHKANISLDYAFGFGFNLHLDGSYISKRFYEDREQLKSLPGYGLVNLKISQKFSRHYVPFIVLKNILDEYYEDEEGYPMPGREFRAGINIDF